MKLVYIPAYAPWDDKDKHETFIAQEMLHLKRAGVDLLIIPRNPPESLSHTDTQSLVESAIWLPLLNGKILAIAIREILTNKLVWKLLWDNLIHSRNPGIFMKNIAVFPKSIYIADMLKNEPVCHIHAHWGSTTATMAYIVSSLTGIKWSFTLHRWDIEENNILLEKVKTAAFVRCISENGQEELKGIVGNTHLDKVKVIHMGVSLPENIFEPPRTKPIYKIAVPANFWEVKGHKYLIDACSILVGKGVINFHCFFFGDGPLKDHLNMSIRDSSLNNYITMAGTIPHEKLMDMYTTRQIDLVILPSIITASGEHEGIPVSLMEAMSYAIPVISTDTGAIHELMNNKAGIIVKEKNSEELAEAINKILNDVNYAYNVGKECYFRIKKDYNISKVTSELINLMICG